MKHKKQLRKMNDDRSIINPESNNSDLISSSVTPPPQTTDSNEVVFEQDDPAFTGQSKGFSAKQCVTLHFENISWLVFCSFSLVILKILFVSSFCFVRL